MLHGDRLLGDMIWDMDATLKAYIQRDQGLGSDDPWDALNNPIEDAHEVIIINRIERSSHRYQLGIFHPHRNWLILSGDVYTSAL